MADLENKNAKATEKTDKVEKKPKKEKVMKKDSTGDLE